MNTITCECGESVPAIDSSGSVRTVCPACHRPLANPNLESGLADNSKKGFFDSLDESLFKTVLTTIVLLVAGVGTVVAVLVVVNLVEGMTRTQATRMKVDIASLEAAVNEYQRLHGDFPPNLDSPDAVDRHLRRVFPRMAADAARPPEGDAAQSLVFWLTDRNANPSDPFGDGGERSSALFEFDKARLKDRRYYPVHSDKPYVYFNARSYETVQYEGLKPYLGDDAAEGTRYVNPRTFQIIAAGRDDDFGTGGSFPSGEGLSDADLDNVVNFGEGPRLGDDLEPEQ